MRCSMAFKWILRAYIKQPVLINDRKLHKSLVFHKCISHKYSLFPKEHLGWITFRTLNCFSDSIRVCVLIFEIKGDNIYAYKFKTVLSIGCTELHESLLMVVESRLRNNTKCACFNITKLRAWVDDKRNRFMVFALVLHKRAGADSTFHGLSSCLVSMILDFLRYNCLISI